MDELESAAAAVDEVVRLAPEVDFAAGARSAVPVLGVAECFGDVARPLPPTDERELLCAEDAESLPVESAWATPVVPDSAVQTPIVSAPVPSQVGSLLCGC
ncbi:hypothetical protein [Mycolicibacterium sp.]|uniref:hypothetical protein n=1 Tax=Mycolicibacterium sp. TaxID=2320850 RepID=UPI0037C7B0B0